MEDRKRDIQKEMIQFYLLQ